MTLKFGGYLLLHGRI